MRLRYWAQEALKFTGIIMAAALFYTFLMIVQDTRETWNEYLEMGALYLGMFGACMCMILGTSVLPAKWEKKQHYKRSLSTMNP